MSTNAVRRNSSEYSNSDGRSQSSCIVQQYFSKEEKSKARSKVYGLLLTDPLALGAILPTILAGGVPIFTFFFLGNILTQLSFYTLDIVEDPLNEISTQCLNMLYVTIAAMVCRGISSLLWIRVGSRISTKIRDEIFTHIMQYDVAFYDQHSIGGLLTIIGEDASVIQECFGATKGLQLQLLGQFLIGWICCMVYSWKLGLIMLCLFSS